MKCSELTAGLVAAECNKTSTAGLEDDIILIDYDAVNKASSTVADNIISEIVLHTGKKGYPFSTFGKSLDEAGTTFVKGTYRNTWQHNVPLRIFTKSQEAKDFVDTIAQGTKIIAVVKNKEVGPNGEVKYEAYGWDNGIELNESANTVAMTDGVVYTLSMGSSETAQEGSLPKSVFDTDIATTEAMLEGITA